MELNLALFIDIKSLVRIYIETVLSSNGQL